MRYPTQSELWRLDHIVHAKPLVTNGQSKILGRFRQVFPLTLFPDQLIIEELRIIHVQNDGPWLNRVNSIMATDIACVNASSGPFFGRVHVQSLTGGPEIFVEHLTRSNVYKIRSLVEGIALASREGLTIGYSNLETERQNLIQAGSIAI